MGPSRGPRGHPRLCAVIGAWAKLLWISAAVGGVAAAAQLGVADALGITRWEMEASTRDWTALLTWIAFCYAVAVVSGALAGRSAVRRHDRPTESARGSRQPSPPRWAPARSSGWRGCLPAPLTPRRTSTRDWSFRSPLAPGWWSASCSRCWLSSARPVAVGLQVTITWLWLAAIGCAVSGLVTHEPFPSPRLGVLDAPHLTGSLWSSPQLMVGAAALVGLVVASVARWRRSGRFGVALAGFGGPAMVAAAYLVAGPVAGSDGGAQADPYLAALIAVGAGLIASVLIAMPGRRSSVMPRQDLNLDELRPIAGDVVSSPGRAGYGQRPGRGDHSRADDHQYGEQTTYGGTITRPRAAESYAPAFSATERQSERPESRPSGATKRRRSGLGCRHLAGRFRGREDRRPDTGARARLSPTHGSAPARLIAAGHTPAASRRAQARPARCHRWVSPPTPTSYGFATLARPVATASTSRDPSRPYRTVHIGQIRPGRCRDPHD